MSDYTAVRGVTLSLKTLLEDRLQAAPLLFTVDVTISRPDVKQTIGGNSQRLNLFLYQALTNSFMANQEDPRTGTTSAYGHPPLCLNLRYLLTTYATDTDETEAHKLLGAAMHVLHDNALLLPDLLRTPPSTLPILDSSLLNAREHLRLSLLPLTLDDLSKIWTNAQESIRLSVAYEVTVIQIESTIPRVSPLPVRERNVVVTTGGPKIAAVEPNVLGIGDACTITGSALFSQTTKVLVDNAVIDLSGQGAPALRSDRIQTKLPIAPAPPADLALWPGPHVLRVTTGFDQANSIATSAFPKTAISNPVPILLIPKITTPVVPATEPGGSAHTLTINGQRLWRAQDDANIYVLIADQTIPASQFTVKTDTQIRVTVPDLPPGEYAVHVRFNAFVSQDAVTFKVT